MPQNKSCVSKFNDIFLPRDYAEVAELVDALDSKSSLAHTRCRFESGLRYETIAISPKRLLFMVKKFSHPISSI